MLVIEPITHIRRDEQGVAWISDTNTKVIEAPGQLTQEEIWRRLYSRKDEVDRCSGDRLRAVQSQREPE